MLNNCVCMCILMWLYSENAREYMYMSVCLSKYVCEYVCVFVKKLPVIYKDF